MQLNSRYKIIPVPISCDTLLLSHSSHHQVIHHNICSNDEMLSLVRHYQNTHRILFISDSYEAGRQVLKVLDEQFQTMNQKCKDIVNVQMQEKVRSLPTLMEKMMKKIDDSSNILHLRNILNKIDNQIGVLNKDVIVGNVRDSKKKVAKANKIKEKKLQNLLRERYTIKQQLRKDRQPSQQEQAQQDQDLLQCLKDQQQINKN